MLQPNERPRPARWGYIDQSTTGGQVGLWTDGAGADSAREALAMIRHAIGVAGDSEVDEIHIRVRGVGVPRSARPEHVVRLEGCDPDVGLSARQSIQLEGALSQVDAPSVDIVVRFTKVG
jgi:hypothetical protein